MPTQHRHIFLSDSGETGDFTTPPRGGAQETLERNRKAHSAKLKEQWAAIWTKARQQEEARSAVSMPTKDGVYVEFEGAPGYELVTKSLEDLRSGIRLLSVYAVQPENAMGQEITRATVFIPSGKQDLFLKKLNEFAEKDTPKGNPMHAPLMRTIEEIRLAVLESFWRDDMDLMPQDTVSAWCEIWLREENAYPGSRSGDFAATVEEDFRETADLLGVPLKERSLRFPERTVLLGAATRLQLNALIESSPYIAEFRRAKETARFFLELQNKEQAEWANELLSRLKVNKNPTVAVCVLDTGANNGHVLLERLLSDGDCHAVVPQWGVNDHRGHGTLMCGVAAFGDLLVALQHDGPIAVEHCLESSKILPPGGDNDPELYGDITIQGISLAEIGASNRSHIGCMAVTSEDGRDRGRPSSWSAAIDKLTSGYDDDGKRLFIMSAGNSERIVGWAQYPQSNLEDSIHDPGQSWNALTIGAYTEKFRLTDPDLQDHTPLAQPGQLSPFSCTSANWDTKWPVKPDIVLEGGNIAQAPGGTFSEHDDLSLLSTGHQPIRRQFDAINATSAAAAQAAWMAAQIQATYPDAWPETIRGLMIHSADWPDALKQQFLATDSRGEYSKTDYGKLLRICGYGVPNLSKAMACASNSLTLISQSELQPYTKKRSTYSTKDMHLHRIPWPHEILLSLGEMTVTMRITLSYFVEPGPGEVGWKDRYRYASHALRFDLNSMGESEEQFLKRLNSAAREEGEKPDNVSGSDRWLIGSNGRNKGSIHSDIWKGTAADIASCNLIGIYPVGGWWRERAWLNRWNRKARYSLIVSLHMPNEEIDIYTPIATQLGIIIET